MYTNGEPQGDIKEYMDWILSDKGQCIIADQGLRPHPRREVQLRPDR